MPSPSPSRPFLLGLSGASGPASPPPPLAQPPPLGPEVPPVVTDYGRLPPPEEAPIRPIPAEDLAPAHADSGRLIIHPIKDAGAVIASGSFLHDGMAIVPCS